VDGLVMNGDSQFLNPSRTAPVPPQSAIVAPVAGAHVTAGTTVVISGKSRARGAGRVANVEVRAGAAEVIATLPWNRVQSTGSESSTWEYRWTPTAAGTVRIESRSNDENGTIEDPHGITVTVDPAPIVQTVDPRVPYANMRVKTAVSSAVYYVGPNGKRYAFPNSNVYHSWYPDFTNITLISADQLADIPLGGAVTYRPGVRLVKLQTDPRVYAVSNGAQLRWITTELVANKLFGVGWAALIDDLSDAFFSHYSIGEPLTEQTFYSSTQQQNGSPTIAKDKEL